MKGIGRIKQQIVLMYSNCDICKLVNESHQLNETLTLHFIRPGSNDNAWESLIEVTKDSETAKVRNPKYR